MQWCARHLKGGGFNEKFEFINGLIRYEEYLEVYQIGCQSKYILSFVRE